MVGFAVQHLDTGVGAEGKGRRRWRSLHGGEEEVGGPGRGFFLVLERRGGGGGAEGGCGGWKVREVGTVFIL